MCFIRRATDKDADEAVAVLRRAIQESCVADHQNDPETLRRWLRNKTPEQFRGWLGDPHFFVAVAVIHSEVIGVGAGRASGDLDLCYIRPDCQRLGVGSRLLVALEAEARLRGITYLRLISTASARPFYERHGYRFIGSASIRGFGLIEDHYYSKDLYAAD